MEIYWRNIEKFRWEWIYRQTELHRYLGDESLGVLKTLSHHKIVFHLELYLKLIHCIQWLETRRKTSKTHLNKKKLIHHNSLCGEGYKLSLGCWWRWENQYSKKHFLLSRFEGWLETFVAISLQSERKRAKLWTFEVVYHNFHLLPINLKLSGALQFTSFVQIRFRIIATIFGQLIVEKS